MKRYVLVVVAAMALLNCSKDEDANPTKDPEVIVRTNDGSKICFGERLSIQKDQIMIMNFDGTEKKELFVDNDFPSDFILRNSTPRFSDDRKKIVFRSNRDLEQNDYDLYIANIDGTDIKQLTDDPDASEDFPELTTDGTAFIFTDNDSKANRQIYKMDLDGKNRVALTNFVNDTRQVFTDRPNFSLDGNKIVFQTDLNSLSVIDIYMMNADGSGLTPVLKNSSGVASFGPQISPDHSKVVFYSTAGKNYQLYVINVDGTGLKQLTDFSSDKLKNVISGDPCWSPDGKMIAFLSNKDKASSSDGYDVYTINADRTNLQRLTETNTSKEFLDWK